MRIYETVTIPERVEDRLVKKRCDLCRRETDRIGLNESSWTNSGFHINATTILVKITQNKGTDYPEGGSGTKYDIDLCPDCFKDKLIPWLRSQGAVIEKLEWDW